MTNIENERVKPIILHDADNGQDYTLEFTKETVKWAEARGFSLDDLDRYPMTKVYEFFFYAFRAHHPNVSRERTDRIIDEAWGGIGGIPDGVIERLGQLYTEPFHAMAKANGDGKNARVTVEL